MQQGCKENAQFCGIFNKLAENPTYIADRNMGASATISRDNSEPKQTQKYGCVNSICAPLGVSISSCLCSRHEDTSTVNKCLLRNCSESWKIISAQVYNINGKPIKGPSVFASSFFIELANLDPENRILSKLKSTKIMPNYERGVLMKMLIFLLSIKDDSFSVKAKIRSVGRRHASIGVTDESIRIFNEAILRTLAVRLDPTYLVKKDIIRQWAILLQFVRVEMLIEKVDFHHCHSGKISSSRHNRRTLHSECSTNEDLDITRRASADFSGDPSPTKLQPFGEPSSLLSIHSL